MKREFFEMLDQQNFAPEAIFQYLGTDSRGLTQDQAEEFQDIYGKNVITHGRKKSLWKQLAQAFINPFTLVLLVLALVSAFTDIIFADPGTENPATVIIISVLVLFSGVLRFVQEARSGNAAARLNDMIQTTTCVERQGRGKEEIPLDELVVGDIVHLSAGDMIPADVRILSAKDLFVGQSALTGESEPVEKLAAYPYKDSSREEADGEKRGESAGAGAGSEILGRTADNPVLGFLGTNVISGSASALVVAVGDDTMLGQMARRLTTKPVQTTFEKGVNGVSWILIRFMLVMVPVVLFVNGFTKRDWLDAALFAISVAVGLTPEMLPMIVTTCLAKGAMAMAKEKVIIKNLNSIQNLGSIDILCTDKTGTLTQDKVVLEYHLDVNGREDLRVLRHAFLNSYYQTGLKNLMDIAIIQRTRELGSGRDQALEIQARESKRPGGPALGVQALGGQALGVQASGGQALGDQASGGQILDLEQRYHKVDEIPFDFERRCMSVVVADQTGKTQMITKGAIEEMLRISTYVEYEGRVTRLTDSMRELVLDKVDSLNQQGMRVLGVAQKTNPAPVGAFSREDEADMVLIGYLAFLDPPKETTASALRALQASGLGVKILTGDNDKVTACICRQVGLPVDRILFGADIARLEGEELKKACQDTTVFAKLSPEEKAKVVTALRDCGHSVGYMGDGINDAAAMKASDVGISVDTAVDIARESADVILLEKDLTVLEKGIIEGRKTYANLMKYIKMTASSNFGNMFSVLAASAFLPFLPMASIQLILLNMIYDISCTAVPWDNVDKDFLSKPRKWEASTIGKFMVRLGPVSSIFDIATYLLMYFLICPMVCGGAYSRLDAAGQDLFIALFQTGWFVESMWSQTLVIHLIRTPRIPFLQSHASWQVTLLTFTGIALLTALPFTGAAQPLGLSPLPLVYFAWLALILVAYMVLVTLAKKSYIRKYKELL